MSAPDVVTPPRPALLWFRGEHEAVRQWLAAGVVEAELTRAEGWSVARPVALPEGLGPYGDPLGLLLSRPVPAELLPVVGMTQREGLLVVAAALDESSGVHWIAVRPGVGPHELGNLPTCGPRFLVDAAGVPDRASEVAALVARGRGAGSSPGGFGVRLALLLGLPGASWVRTDEPLPGGEVVALDEREVQRFMSVLGDRLLERAEREEGR